ncbi:hypothetical protein AGMMS49992_24840 [Clostridia bacterium]|nr:hypothetical protein AGMMS49992_24840 [Clostridia bacterium]
MDKHPIQSLMSTTMENIKDMVDVNTVVGDPVTTSDGTTIIPISRVSFGFVSGGGEYNNARSDEGGILGNNTSGAANYSAEDLPFAGGTGAGVSVHPMGFLVVGQGQVKMLPTNYATPVDRVMELLPQVIGEIKDVFQDDDATVSGSSAGSTLNATRNDHNHTRSIPVEGRTIGSGMENYTHYDNKPDSARFEGKYDTKADAARKFDSKFDSKANTGLNGPSAATVTNSVNASSTTKQ